MLLKKCAGFAFGALMLSMAGCMQPPTTVPTEIPEDSLSVYYVSYPKVYNEAIAKYETEVGPIVGIPFETAEQMSENLKIAIESGDVPDVVLFEQTSTLDIHKLVADGHFLALDDMKLDENTYYTQILDAGVVDGKQYIMPLSYRLLSVYGNANLMNTNGTSISEDYEAIDIFEAIESDIDASESVMGYCTSIIGVSGAQNFLTYMMDVLNEPIVDFATNEVVLEKDVLKEIADMYKKIVTSTEKIVEVKTAFAESFVNLVKHSTFFIEDTHLLNNLRQYNSYFPEVAEVDLMWYPIPTYQDNEKYSVFVDKYAVVSSTTEHKDEALEFLQIILDYPRNNDFNKFEYNDSYELSLNKNVMASNIEEIKTTAGEFEEIVIAPLTEDLTNDVQNIVDNIVSGVIPHYGIAQIVTENMKPYVDGENEDFDSIYNELVEKLNVYLNE